MTAQLIAIVSFALAIIARSAPGWIDSWTKSRIATKAAEADAAVKVADAKKADADAALVRAQADKLSAETAQHALEDFRARLNECEKKHLEQDATIEHMKRQRDADAVLVKGLGDKAEKDEAIIRGLKSRVDQLEKDIKSGGSYAS